MSNYYDPRVVRALTCERIREARGSCIDGFTFERSVTLGERLRRLLGRLSFAASAR